MAGDPLSVVALGREGSGGAQIFDTRAPIKTLQNEIARKDKKAALQAKLDADAAKQKQKQLQDQQKLLSKIKPVTGKLIPYYTEKLNEWQTNFFNNTPTEELMPGHPNYMKHMSDIAQMQNTVKEWEKFSEKLYGTVATLEADKDKKYDQNSWQTINDAYTNPDKYLNNPDFLTPGKKGFDYAKMITGAKSISPTGGAYFKPQKNAFGQVENVKYREVSYDDAKNYVMSYILDSSQPDGFKEGFVNQLQTWGKYDDSKPIEENLTNWVDEQAGLIQHKTVDVTGQFPPQMGGNGMYTPEVQGNLYNVWKTMVYNAAQGDITELQNVNNALVAAGYYNIDPVTGNKVAPSYSYVIPINPNTKPQTLVNYFSQFVGGNGLTSSEKNMIFSDPYKGGIQMLKNRGYGNDKVQSILYNMPGAKQTNNYRVVSEGLSVNKEDNTSEPMYWDLSPNVDPMTGQPIEDVFLATTNLPIGSLLFDPKKSPFRNRLIQRETELSGSTPLPDITPTPFNVNPTPSTVHPKQQTLAPTQRLQQQQQQQNTANKYNLN